MPKVLERVIVKKTDQGMNVIKSSISKKKPKSAAKHKPKKHKSSKKDQMQF